MSGTAFAAKGSGLDAFDAEAGDTVKVKWTQGGEEKEATIAPAEIAADKLSFEFPDALVGVPVDTELTFEITFEITFGETLKSKGSKLWRRKPETVGPQMASLRIASKRFGA